ncbi:hypothetical protein MKL09_07285 [Methylobacterium sp. J-048]|uniref:hypothetical protein n=1 Tax=Methylobacterium sp. J-048 TaxID=2836635 RepID=UPI001FBB8135|nr:hypothetical protein [Methylobacterium sp. J-048]MCJ2056351.1 hypothetical protein [Methylobacterium sp. J-048]
MLSRASVHPGSDLAKQSRPGETGREFLDAAEQLHRVVRHLPDRENTRRRQAGKKASRDAASVFSKEFGRVRKPLRRPAGPEKGQYHYRRPRGFGKGQARDDVTVSSWREGGRSGAGGKFFAR